MEFIKTFLTLKVKTRLIDKMISNMFFIGQSHGTNTESALVIFYKVWNNGTYFVSLSINFNVYWKGNFKLFQTQAPFVIPHFSMVLLIKKILTIEFNIHKEWFWEIGIKTNMLQNLASYNKLHFLFRNKIIAAFYEKD
jgi:hypothetical protein